MSLEFSGGQTYSRERATLVVNALVEDCYKSGGSCPSFEFASSVITSQTSNTSSETSNLHLLFHQPVISRNHVWSLRSTVQPELRLRPVQPGLPASARLRSARPVQPTIQPTVPAARWLRPTAVLWPASAVRLSATTAAVLRSAAVRGAK